MEIFKILKELNDHLPADFWPGVYKFVSTAAGLAFTAIVWVFKNVLIKKFTEFFAKVDSLIKDMTEQKKESVALRVALDKFIPEVNTKLTLLETATSSKWEASENRVMDKIRDMEILINELSTDTRILSEVHKASAGTLESKLSVVFDNRQEIKDTWGKIKVIDDKVSEVDAFGKKTREGLVKTITKLNEKGIITKGNK